MRKNKLGEKLQILRKDMGYTQKDFAEFLEIPQPSLSAYENNKNSPTTDVLMNIALKCNISLDWLCGLSETKYSVATLGDVSELLYKLLELNEIGIEMEINDYLLNDIETNIEKWYTRLTIYGNDKRYRHNSFLCTIIRKIQENISDLETYGISAETYEINKKAVKEKMAEFPVSKKQFPEYSREERLKKHIEYLKSLSHLC